MITSMGGYLYVDIGDDSRVTAFERDNVSQYETKLLRQWYQEAIDLHAKYEADTPGRRFSEEDLQNILEYAASSFNCIEEELIKRGEA